MLHRFEDQYFCSAPNSTAYQYPLTHARIHESEQILWISADLGTDQAMSSMATPVDSMLPLKAQKGQMYFLTARW